MTQNWSIDPPGSLGPLHLGMTLDEALAVAGRPEVVRESGGYVTLVYEYTTILAVDDAIVMLAAEFGSKCAIVDSDIVVGMPYASLLGELKAPLVFDEENDLWHSADFQGVFFAIARPGDPGIDSVEFVSQPYAVTRPEVSILHSMLLQ